LAVVTAKFPVIEVTAIESVAEANCRGEELSAAMTMKSYWPATVGVPESAPSGERTRPGGRLLAASSVHETGAVPPDAPSCAEYATPTDASTSDVVPTRSGDAEEPAPEIVIDTVRSSEAGGTAESATVTTNDEVPAAVGVPVTEPDGESPSPLGSVPLEMLQE
jgi:hypothetical protein